MNLLFQMLGKLAGKGLALSVVLEFFALNLAWILALAVPMAVLIATLSAYGRLSADGEITALRASGVSPWQMILPTLAVSVVVAVGVLLFSNYLLPDMNHRAKLLRIDISRKKPTLNIEPGTYAFDIPHYVLHAERVDQHTGGIEEVAIYDEHVPGVRSTIIARHGRIRFEPREEVIYLTLDDGEIHRPTSHIPGDYEWTHFDSALFRVPAPGMVLRRGTSAAKGDREKSVKVMLSEVRRLKQQPPGRRIQRRIDGLMVEVHKKFSIPAACIVFILIGAPLGILAHKGGLGVAGAVSLIFFTVYWAFLVNGEDLAERGFISPAVAMWSPNVLLALIGVWFLWLARRRTSLPGIGWISERLVRWFSPAGAVDRTKTGDQK